MLKQGVSKLMEIGPGKVLAGLIKRINRDAEMVNIGDLAAIKRLVGT